MRLRVILVTLLVFPLAVFAAGGLSSNWGEVIIDNLETGETYALNDYAGSPFTIANNFDNDVSLKLEVLKPEPKELKPGYEPIPDISWVKLEKKQVEIAGLKKEIVNVKVSIPDDKQYAGKKYHFWIWSYTTGQAMGVGLKSRVLISIIK